MKFQYVAVASYALGASALAFSDPLSGYDIGFEAPLLRRDIVRALVRRVNTRPATPTPQNPKVMSTGHEIKKTPSGDMKLSQPGDPNKPGTHANSVASAQQAGTPMSHLPLSTDQQHKDYTNHVQKQPSAGQGMVREDEPPRAAALPNPSDRHIQPAAASESPAQGNAVKEQKKLAKEDAARHGGQPQVGYDTVEGTNVGGHNLRPHKRSLAIAQDVGFQAGYKRAIEDLARRSLVDDMGDFDFDFDF